MLDSSLHWGSRWGTAYKVHLTFEHISQKGGGQEASAEKMCRSEPKNELTSFMQEEKSQVERKEETMEKIVRERQRKGHGKNK